MVDAVAGQDRHRPLDRKTAVDDRLGDAPRRIPNLGESQRPPAVAGAFGEIDALGLNFRPMIQPMRDRRWIRPEFMARANQHGAVRRRSTETSGGPKVSRILVIAPPWFSYGTNIEL